MTILSPTRNAVNSTIPERPSRYNVCFTTTALRPCLLVLKICDRLFGPEAKAKVIQCFNVTTYNCGPVSVLENVSKDIADTLASKANSEIKDYGCLGCIKNKFSVEKVGHA